MMQAPPRKSSVHINGLARELLSMIFLHYLASNPRLSTHRSSQGPLLLGRICSRWRTVSTSTSDLWSSFSVGSTLYSSVIDNSKDLNATNLWILRSGTRPLSVRVTYFTTPSTLAVLFGEKFPQIILAVVSQSWRWKRIRMTILAYLTLTAECMNCPSTGGIREQYP
ncbi:hypothetical protein BD410DRAFT_79113 [Rickenella mellea]|uniref:F-box domain-containing protein n=1 Tax=Rickenella mellea TaxID=50990 RepID=A0A4Y7PKR2_9AGAM|nr:hypothetical protein BD410DRAFT_79113 [Rickenella mellea]